MKTTLCCIAVVVAFLGFGLSAEAQTSACGTAAAPFLAAGTPTLQEMIPGLTPAPQETGPVCPFCNLTSYSSCESLNGNSCGAQGLYRRCYVEPACYCEWGACICNGSTWDCYW